MRKEGPKDRLSRSFCMEGSSLNQVNKEENSSLSSHDNTLPRTPTGPRECVIIAHLRTVLEKPNEISA